ncbi:dephospho-CoA kinase [Nematocida major]|uniref:dephospho-CoA kinase n=1 Tax=Nematocida major TaxID=1912982 RepID=UPI002008DE8A|nr:dephospho-CoA kinase [Nematocida major]KAH9387004.1 dephospho-CoA kinase [Nematocida major]
MKIVGITGGVCTGTSTVIDYIEKKGFAVIKAPEIYAYLEGIDALSKYNLRMHLTNKENAIKTLARTYFLKYLKNREVFFRLMCKAVVFVEVPFLFECGLSGYFSQIAVITCGPKTQKERLTLKYSMDRSEKKNASKFSLSEKDALEVAEHQAQMLEKRAHCDTVIDNNKGIDHTFLQVDAFLNTHSKLSVFYLVIVTVAVASIFLPILARYKEEASRAAKKAKSAIDAIRKNIKNHRYG